MNIKLKTFMMALVLVPVALCFAACGGPLDSNATINVSGNYQNSSETELNTYLSDESTSVDNILSGMKMSMSLRADEGDVSYVCIIKTTETKSEMLFKLTSKAKKASDADYSGTITAYLVQETVDTQQVTTLYLDGKMEGQEFKKVKVTGSNAERLASAFTYMKELSNGFLPSSKSDMTITEVKKATSDQTTKWKVDVTGENDTKASLYYVFENGVFAGFKIDNFAMNMGDMVTTISAAMCPYSDAINFDTNGYTELTA